MSENPPAADQEISVTPSVDPGDVKLIPRYDDQVNHPNCLVVAPFRDAKNGPVIMANVEHYLENKEATGFPWKITRVIEAPLSLKVAVDVALEYAKTNKVPVILLNQDGFSTDAERRQTDTKVLKI